MPDFEKLTDGANKVIQDTFSIAVIYLRNNGGEYPIKAIFDRAYLAVDPESEAVVQSTGPVALVRLADLPFLPGAGDRMVIKGATYRVVASEVDGYGNSLLRLHIK